MNKQPKTTETNENQINSIHGRNNLIIRLLKEFLRALKSDYDCCDIVCNSVYLLLLMCNGHVLFHQN